MRRFCKLDQKNTEFLKHRNKLRQSVKNFQHKNFLAENPTKDHASLLASVDAEVQVPLIKEQIESLEEDGCCKSEFSFHSQPSTIQRMIIYT